MFYSVNQNEDLTPGHSISDNSERLLQIGKRENQNVQQFLQQRPSSQQIKQLLVFVVVVVVVVVVFLLGLQLQSMEVPRPGVKLQLLLLAYTITTATWDLSSTCDLHHSSRQGWNFNPLSKGRDQACNLKDTSWFLYH